MTTTATTTRGDIQSDGKRARPTTDTSTGRDEHRPLGAGTVNFRAIPAALGPERYNRLCAEGLTGDQRLLRASSEKLAAHREGNCD